MPIAPYMPAHWGETAFPEASLRSVWLHGVEGRHHWR